MWRLRAVHSRAHWDQPGCTGAHKSTKLGPGSAPVGSSHPCLDRDCPLSMLPGQRSFAARLINTSLPPRTMPPTIVTELAPELSNEPPLLLPGDAYQVVPDRHLQPFLDRLFASSYTLSIAPPPCSPHIAIKRTWRIVVNTPQQNNSQRPRALGFPRHPATTDEMMRMHQLPLGVRAPWAVPGWEEPIN